MNKNRIRGLVLKIMLFLNFSLITYLSLISAVSIVKVSRSMQARAFIDSLSQVPPVPWTIPVGAIGCFLLLMCLLYGGRASGISEGLICLGAVALGVAIILILDMNYNGIIFLVAAYLMDYFNKDKKKFLFIMIFSVCLLIFDFNICSKFMSIISFDVYVAYYNNMVASILLALKNLGTTVNIVH